MGRGSDSVEGEASSLDPPPQERWLWGFALWGACVGALGLALGPVRLDARALLEVVLRWIGLPLLALYCRFRGAPRLAHSARVVAWGTFLSWGYSLPMYVLAALGAPLRDGALTRLDGLLGAPTPALVALCARHPALASASERAYDLLLPFSLAALFVPTLRSRSAAGYRFPLSLVLASLSSLTVFALAPARGPWVAGAFAPTAGQRSFEAVFTALRAGRPVLLDVRAPVPLITMPSWHALLAVLAGLALAQERWLRGPSLLFAGAIVLSTMSTGWHYASDVLVGVALALVSWWGAGRLLARST